MRPAEHWMAELTTSRANVSEAQNYLLSMCVSAKSAGKYTEWREKFKMTSATDFCRRVTTETEQDLYTEAESRPSVTYQYFRVMKLVVEMFSFLSL